ncbi:aspartate kinase [Peptostreptococcus faecalis]|uniref:aspartate kinase n=1 Tax=Peptostreptococcus faecalis TaxID=2045015 RepID=UPI000C7C4A64|nr:aspartate kinase [Peptostreptococcus faecalis]
MNRTTVLKFGGSSVSSVNKIKEISKYLKERSEKGEKLVVVVSAMGATTDELLKKVSEITDNPNPRELDTLLSIGEQNTISLMSIALNDLGVKSRSLTGMQAGIKTFGKHTKSKIAGIDVDFISKELEKYDVLVVAGFQGFNENFEITTLGRGGSDTSAVALAATIGAPCEIYTDVIGVYGTDPRIYPEAKKINRISYEEMLELSALGAGVLEPRCVEIAKNYNVAIYIAKTLSETKGTWIMANTDLLEKKVVTGVALDKDILHVTLTYVDDSSNFVEELFNQLDQYSINIDMISQVVFENSINISFTCKVDDKNDLNEVIDNLEKAFNGVKHSIRTDFAKISIVGSGMRDVSGVAARSFRVLSSNGIKFYQVTTSEISISYAIDGDNSTKAVTLLCKEFDI